MNVSNQRGFTAVLRAAEGGNTSAYKVRTVLKKFISRFHHL